MSPPIRDGSGDSIGSIRLGDGSEIAEVRTGAGDVVFSAIPDSVVLLPESDDLTHFSGDTGSFDINNNSPVYQTDNNNDLSLKSTASGVIGSDSGLDNYPSTDTQFRVRLYIEDASTDDIRLFYSSDSPDSTIDNNGSGYGVLFNAANSDFGIFRRNSGSFNGIEIDTSFSFASGTWYTLNLTHQSDGIINFELINEDTGSTVKTGSPTDTNLLSSGSFDSTGINFRVDGGSPKIDQWYQPNA
jgi:hypothetical protein